MKCEEPRPSGLPGSGNELIEPVDTVIVITEKDSGEDASQCSGTSS